MEKIMTKLKTRLTADRAARYLDRAIARGGLDAATTTDAQQLVDRIDAGPVKGLAGEAEALIGAGFRRGALAVAAADTPRGVKAAVAGIKAVAALADSLGLAPADDADVAPEAEPEADTVSDTATSVETTTAWNAA